MLTLRRTGDIFKDNNLIKVEVAGKISRLSDAADAGEGRRKVFPPKGDNRIVLPGGTENIRITVIGNPMGRYHRS